MEDTGNSLREALTSAFDSQDASEPPATGEVTETAPVEAQPSETPEAPETPLETKQRTRDEKGRYSPRAATETKTPAPKQAKPEAAQTATDAPPKAEVSATEPPAPEVKAPASWKATLREKWPSLPAEVQQEVHRRENEIRQALQEAAPAKKNWQSFQQAVAPYQGMLQAERLDPIAAVGDLLQTAQALRTAPPQHKAQIVANIIKTFNVPIDPIAAALEGNQQPQAQGQAPAEFRDPRVDQLLAQLQQQEQQRTSALVSNAQRTVESFSADKEFLDDVREDMADLMELSAKRGVAMTIEQAYSRAVAMHPEVSQVLQQREAAKNAANAQASTMRARAAASSIKSQPAGATTPQPKGLREHIEAAFGEYSGR